MTLNVENRSTSIDSKIWIKDIYIYMLLIERNRTNIRILDLKSTFKISTGNIHVFSQIIYMALLFNCFLHP